jgi:hypothetical protein
MISQNPMIWDHFENTLILSGAQNWITRKSEINDFTGCPGTLGLISQNHWIPVKRGFVKSLISQNKNSLFSLSKYFLLKTHQLLSQSTFSMFSQKTLFIPCQVLFEIK